MNPTLNIIHLEPRHDRLESFKQEMNNQNIMYAVWEGIIAERPWIGINKAHKQIVQYAKDENMPFVIIAEDDIKFFAEGAWKYYLSQMPEDFDLYCGVIYDGEFDSNNRIITTKGMSGTNTLYTISRRFYDVFLNTDNSKHLDRELGTFAMRFKYYVCNPMVCKQSGGYSDNLKRKMYYDEYLLGKPIFTK